MNFTYRHNNQSFAAEIHRIGPAIQVVAFEGEFYVSLSIGWMQSGQSSAVVTTWQVDGPANAQMYILTNQDLCKYWRFFLAAMPPGLAEAVSLLENTISY